MSASGGPEGPQPRSAPERRDVDLRRAALRVVLVVVVGLLVAEAGVRLIDQQLPAPGTDDRGEVLVKHDQLQALADAGGAQVAFVGSSPLDAGADATRFSQASTSFDSAYNAGLLGIPTYLQADWAAQHVVPATGADVVVIGLGPLDVVQGASPADGAELTQAEVAPYEAKLLDTFDVVDDGWMRWVEDHVESRSALVRHRSAMHHPMAVWDALWATASGAAPPEAPLPGGTGFSPAEVREDGAVVRYHGRSGGALPASLEGLLTDSLESSVRADRVDSVVGAVEGAGADAVVVVPPMNLAAVPPEAAQAYLDVAAEIVARAEELDVPVLDLSGADYPADHYADAIHLNEVGAAALADQVAAWLDQLCTADEVSCPSPEEDAAA